MILPDVLGPNLLAVLCGTAPSRASAAAAAYYAHPGNRFWATLHEVGLTPVRLAPHQYDEVRRYRLGLTDLNKTEFGADSDLSRDGYDAAGFLAKMRLHRPAAIAFDSKTAARSFFGRAVACGRQPEDLEGMAVFVLPSPSGRARSHWDIGPWEELGAFVKALRGNRGVSGS